MRALLPLGLAFSLALTHPPVPDATGSGSAARCSVSPNLVSRSDVTSLLLGVATPDTLEVGPGPFASTDEPGHSGPGGSGPIFGQLIEVARVGGAGSARVEEALARRGDRRVVVVPWDYDPSCRTTRWSAGFAWVPPADTGTYRLRLRPEDMWVDGIPVFDVTMAVFQPYPIAPYFGTRGGLRRLPPRPWLSAAEYFDMLLGGPSAEAVRSDPAAAWRELQAFKAASPHLLERFPGTELEEDVASSIRRAKIDSVHNAIEPLFAGTWRLTFSLRRPASPDAAVQPIQPGERTFYARTRATITGPWLPSGQRPEYDSDPLAPVPRPDGYSVFASTAASLDELPMACGRAYPAGPGAYVYILEPPPGTGRTSWEGWIENGLVARQFPDDPGLQEFSRAAFREWGDRRRATTGSREAPATFTLDEDGVLRVEQMTRTSDGRELFLRGERISLEAHGDC